MSNQKDFFHYRNAFDTEYLSSADIEELAENNGGKAILTITRVEYHEQRKIAGKVKDRSLIVFFKEKDTKPMVLNSTNAKVLANLIGHCNQLKWQGLNLAVELYVDYNVRMGGNQVSGIRIKEKKITTVKQQLTDKRFAAAIEAIKKGQYTVEKIMQNYELSPQQKKELVLKHKDLLTPAQLENLKNTAQDG